MSTFSVNQVRHLYVAKGLKTPKVISTDPAGSIAVKTNKEKSSLYFEYMGAGGQTRSDLINIKNIESATATDASKLSKSLKKIKVTLDSTVNAGAPVSGQDYLLRLFIRNYIGISEQDQYTKHGMVHTTFGMTASNFYKILAFSLVKNFSRETNTFFNFFLETGGTKPETVGALVAVDKNSKEDTFKGTYTGIVIEEAPQDWTLGVFAQVPVNFEVTCATIVANGDEVLWANIKKVAPTSSIKNGKNIADLEYFCMGERGDIYRKVGFPNIINTSYLVDPTLEYNTIDIHYSYIGSNESSQKSEKDITLVIPKVGVDNATGNALTNTIITAINSATGLAIPVLAVV